MQPRTALTLPSLLTNKSPFTKWSILPGMTDWISFSCSFYYSISTDSHTNNNSQREDNIVLLSRRHSNRHSSVPHRIPRWNWEEYRAVVDFRRLVQVESLVDVFHRHACLGKRRIREGTNCLLSGSVPFTPWSQPLITSPAPRRNLNLKTQIALDWKISDRKNVLLTVCLSYTNQRVHLYRPIDRYSKHPPRTINQINRCEYRAIYHFANFCFWSVSQANIFDFEFIGVLLLFGGGAARVGILASFVGCWCFFLSFLLLIRRTSSFSIDRSRSLTDFSATGFDAWPLPVEGSSLTFLFFFVCGSYGKNCKKQMSFY